MSHSPANLVLYGGTFDPFHVGHETICSVILAEPMVDQLRLLPCYLPALKSAASASAEHRLSMLLSWHKQHEHAARILIDDRELTREGKTYTVDTVKELLCLPSTKLTFALGADAWNSLPQWKNYSQLIGLVGFWVFTRQGGSPLIEHEGLTQLSCAADLVNSAPGYCYFDKNLIPVVASSTTRNIQDYEKWPVPPAIKQYIKQNSLYPRVGALSEGRNDR